MWWLISISYFIIFIIVLRLLVREKRDAIIDSWDSGYIIETHWSFWKVFLSLIWPITFVVFIIYMIIY